MWIFRSKQLPDNRGIYTAVDLDSQPASFADVVRAWADNGSFRSLFNEQLAEVPYAAFRWETPPVTDTTVNRPFEFVVLDCPGLARRPDPEAFAAHFTNDPVVVFPNLGGDALLVVPSPHASPSAYGHLATFVRMAPKTQRHVLWQSVGEAMSQRVGAKPVWLSTAGGGVSWLHVRLDDRPKYYSYEPYKQLSAAR